MTALYIASWTEGAGKTALCAGIGRHLQSGGKKVGYLKPVALAETGADKDAQFLKQALELEEPAEALCAVRLTRQDILTELKSDSLSSKAKQAYTGAAKGKDIVLLEGLSGLGGDTELCQASYQIVEALDARVVIVVAYSNDLPGEKIASSAGKFGPRLLGVVINQVPQSKMELIRTEMISMFDREGIKVLGVLPEERLLLGVSIAELAEHLQATFLCCPEASGELVGNVMIGALSVDSGADYFNRKADKVVIARGSRPDIQLAALATPTKGLILSEDIAPIPQVLIWAEDKGVPILLSKQDTLPTVAEVEETILQARFRQEKKIGILGEILEQHFDFNTLYQGLGLA